MGGGAETSRRYGGFDGLRILAALAVVFSHSYALTGNLHGEPRVKIGPYPVGFGVIGVSIFFVTSGFLVAMSWDRSHSSGVFTRSRIVRIWPALVTLVLVSVFVLGPLVTTLSTREYFSRTMTVRYLGRNLTMLFGPSYFLPGVFRGQPSAAINGSLWTLPYELWAYIAVLALGVIGVLRRPIVVVTIAIIGLILFRLGSYSNHIPLQHSMLGVNLASAAELGSWFLMGVVLSRFRDQLQPKRVALLAVLSLAIAFALHEPILFLIGFSAGVIAVGSCQFVFSAPLHRLGDPSYGIYIFSFPIQQTLYRTGVATTPWAMFAIAAPLSIAAGYLSWHLVESPALRRFKFRSKKQVTPPVTAETSE